MTVQAFNLFSKFGSGSQPVSPALQEREDTSTVHEKGQITKVEEANHRKDAVKVQGFDLFSKLGLWNSGIRSMRSKAASTAEQVQLDQLLDQGGCELVDFLPYSAKVPWHTGFRGIFCRLFPRYGNYCGPNWSSGRESGSLLWDKKPIDALDHCCFFHDIGYDGHDQRDLHRADLRFLDCLEKVPKRPLALSSPVSEIYRNVYIFGLKNFLVPYRKYLINQSSGRLPEVSTALRRMHKDM